MTPRMQEILHEISVLTDPDPNVIFQRITQAVGDYYAGSMVMINLFEGDCLQFRMTINPHPVVESLTSIPVEGTYCQRTMAAKRPLLIQNATQSEQFCQNPMVQLNLIRYLGTPVLNMEGVALGTLCMLDGRAEEILHEADVRFLSVLAMRVSAELQRERLTLARIEEHRLAAERNDALVAQLQVNAEEKRRFVSMVIHDLRHPLATIQTILYLLRDEEIPEERVSLVDTLENRTRALSTLLDGLTECHKIEAGQLPLYIRSVDIERHLQDCITNFAPDLRESAIECRWEIDPELGSVMTDGDKLTHIILNLLSNALKFTLEGCIVVRGLAAGPDTWTLEVEDTGIGIPAEDQERVFEEFYRAPAADHSLRPGSGLGLAIVKRLCDILQGRIEIESEYGKGTRFRITFPREMQPAEELETQKVEAVVRN